MKVVSASLTLALTAFVSANASAGGSSTVNMIKNPPCISCSIDALKSGSVKITPSKVAGSNGFVVKVKLTGMSNAGVPFNSASSYLSLFLSIDGGPCTEYQGPNMSSVDGTAKATYSAAQTTPVFSASAGSGISLCGPVVYNVESVALPGNFFSEAVSGLHTGS
jgi:hypothetical protein